MPEDRQKKPLMRQETENYIIRTITDDLVTDAMVAWYASEEIMRYMNDPMNLSADQFKKHIWQI